MIGLMKGEVKGEQVQAAIDGVDEADLSGQGMDGADAAASEAAGAFGDLVVNVAGREHGPVARGPLGAVEPSLDAALRRSSCRRFLVSLEIPLGRVGLLAYQPSNPAKSRGISLFSRRCPTKSLETTLVQGLGCLIADLNRTLRGWFVYFQHSHRTTFADVDRWVRIRLRSILSPGPAGRHGRGRGRDHQRWPNSFFAAHGYFSLEAAYAAACQCPLG